jgi:hypothetical protein
LTQRERGTILLMRVLCISAILTLCAGSICVEVALSRAAPSEWRPIALPYPPQSTPVSAQFHLASGGKFDLQVETATSQPERTSIQTPATVTICGPNFRTTRAVVAMNLGARSGDTDFYSVPEPFVLPHRGNYEIVFASVASVPPFADHGAVIRLERLGSATSGVFYFGLQWLGNVVIALAAALILLIMLVANKVLQ